MEERKLKKVWSVGRIATAEGPYEDHDVIDIHSTFDTFEAAAEDLRRHMSPSFTVIERWVLE